MSLKTGQEIIYIMFKLPLLHANHMIFKDTVIMNNPVFSHTADLEAMHGHR